MVNPIQNELRKREEKTITAHRIASKEKKEKKSGILFHEHSRGMTLMYF